jgi:hypothetical protein
MAAATGRPLIESYTDPRTGGTRQRRRTAIGASSINKTITRLGQILEVAVEYGIVDRNRLPGADAA